MSYIGVVERRLNGPGIISLMPLFSYGFNDHPETPDREIGLVRATDLRDALSRLGAPDANVHLVLEDEDRNSETPRQRLNGASHPTRDPALSGANGYVHAAWPCIYQNSFIE